MYKNLKKKHFVFLIVLVPLLIFGLSGCSEDEKATVISIWEGDTNPIPITGNYPADDATVDSRIICAAAGSEVLRWNSVVDPIDEGGDDDADLIFYDVYFGTTEDPPLLTRVASNEGTQTVQVTWGTLQPAYDPGLVAPNNKLPNGTSYYWRIVATDMGGNITESDEWSFTTSSNNRPEEPTLAVAGFPANGAIGVNMNGEFQWTVPADWDEDQLTCDIYISTTPVFTTAANTTPLYPVAFADPDYTFNFTPAAADIESPNTTYYWKVVVSDWDDGSAAAVSSVSSEVWTFETNDVDYNDINFLADFMSHDAAGDLSTSTANMDENKNNLAFASAPVIDITKGFPFPSLYLVDDPDTVSLAGTINPFDTGQLSFDFLIENENNDILVEMPNVSGSGFGVELWIAGDDGDYAGDTAAQALGTTNYTDSPGGAPTWGTTNETFTINVDGAGVQTVTLDATCDNIGEVFTELNTAIDAAVGGGVISAIIHNTDYIEIRHDATGLTSTFVLADGTGTPLADMGIAVGNYTGTDNDDDYDLMVYTTDYNATREDAEIDYTERTFAGLVYAAWNNITIDFNGAASPPSYNITVNSGTPQTVIIGEDSVANPAKYYFELGLANDFTISCDDGEVWIDNISFDLTGWTR